MKRLVLSVGVLGLAACGGERPQEAAAPSEPVRETQAASQAPDATSSAPGAGGGWTMQASATAGAALVHTAKDGAEDLRVACRRNPADLWVSAPRFSRIGSEDRLSLGAGDKATALVADLQAEGAGVEASGPVAPEFLEALRAGGEIGVSYGSQALRLTPPEPATAERFARSCAG
jgi:hypothetical protein